MELNVRSLTTGYGALYVCRSIDLQVREGEVVALLGPNGAGKTTLLKCVAGGLPAYSGSIVAGSTDITDWAIAQRIRHGIVHVSQELDLFADMSVAENLHLGGYAKKDRAGDLAARKETVLELFPRLGQRLRQTAGTMSGGEQRMLAIGRGMMSGPRLLLLDEPCTGLHVSIQETLFSSLERIAKTGTSILVAEQNIPRATASANRTVYLSNGSISRECPGGRRASDEAGVGATKRIDPRERAAERSGGPGDE